MKILAVFVFVLTYSIVARGDNIIGVEFNSPSAKENTYSKDFEFKKEGKFSEKFILKHGQCGQSDGYSDCLMDRGRVERQTREIRGNQHWYKFSFYIDDTWPTKLKFRTMIIQSKIRDVRPPIWGLELEHGNLQLVFHQLQQYCDILDYNEIVNRWVNITLYTNFGDEPTNWFKNNNKKAQIWIDGIPKKAYCGYSESGLVPNEYKPKLKKHGSSTRYGIYHSYVSRDLSLLNPNITLQGWVDEGASGSGNIRSMTNDPWSIDWEVLYPTKNIWWDDMQYSTAKNPWNVNLSESNKIYGYE